MKLLSDPPKRVVGQVFQAHRASMPKGWPGLKGLQARRASRHAEPPGPIYKGKQGKAKRGKGKWSRAKASGVRASRARISEAKAGKAKLREGRAREK